MLVVGKTQLLPQPLGIFRNGDGERAKPAHGIRLEPIAASTFAMFSKLAR